MQITEHLTPEQHKQWVYNVSEADICDSLNQLEKMTMPMPVNHPDYLDVRKAYEEFMEVCMSGTDGQIPVMHILTYFARFIHQLKMDPRIQEGSEWGTAPSVLTSSLVQAQEA
jgi:hypothetical protein|tara:strand:- start:441 stop:779 length:339 start_codon:yes stop_codon:yes gene_type:complete